jgi:hypothetical protein
MVPSHVGKVLYLWLLVITSRCVLFGSASFGLLFCFALFCCFVVLLFCCFVLFCFCLFAVYQVQ